MIHNKYIKAHRRRVANTIFKVIYFKKMSSYVAKRKLKEKTTFSFQFCEIYCNFCQIRAVLLGHFYSIKINQERITMMLSSVTMFMFTQKSKIIFLERNQR